MYVWWGFEVVLQFFFFTFCSMFLLIISNAMGRTLQFLRQSTTQKKKLGIGEKDRNSATYDENFFNVLGCTP
ncbi:hypothetical protein V8C37DRAFT_372383 [Trichoderma ceciliae]